MVPVECPGVLGNDVAITGSSRGVMLNILGVGGGVGLPPPLGWVCAGVVSAPRASVLSAVMLGADSKESDGQGLVGRCRVGLPRAVWPVNGHSGWWPCLRWWCADCWSQEQWVARDACVDWFAAGQGVGEGNGVAKELGDPAAHALPDTAVRFGGGIAMAVEVGLGPGRGGIGR